MKLALFFCLIALTVPGHAQPQQIFTVKQRLRILLWTEGLEQSKGTAKERKGEVVKLPEELERPLRLF